MWKLWLWILRLWATLSVWNISLVLPAECPTVLRVPIIYEWWWKSNVFFSDTANCDLIIWHFQQDRSFGGRSHLFHSRHVWSQREKHNNNNNDNDGSVPFWYLSKPWQSQHKHGKQNQQPETKGAGIQPSFNLLRLFSCHTIIKIVLCSHLAVFQSLQWKYHSMDSLISFSRSKFTLVLLCSFVRSVNCNRGTI